MRKKTKKRSAKSGTPPGTLLHIGEKKTEQVKITVVDYDEAHYTEQEIVNIGDCLAFKDKPTTTWINITGIHQLDIIEKIGGVFGLHPLLLEDVVNTEQRPKIEDFEDYLFVVLKFLSYKKHEEVIEPEQISIIIGLNFVISFQEIDLEIFHPIQERIRNGKGKIKKSGADYLAYTLIDTIVDNYFILLEILGDRIDRIEEELISYPTTDTLQKIHALNNELLLVRKSIWPLRVVVNTLEKTEPPLIRESTEIYLRDVYDHTIQIIDTIEAFRDIISGMLDIYLSSVSNKMNEVMKVLTIIATIFIPLTFIAGIYGMNFHYIPELEWRWSYFAVLLVMGIVGISMVFYFWKKKWL